ncbi:hypothetical protein ACFVR1_06905 [Psychrobacillus sp. NPDC058041]|uniref:hypothetical protein n=1 Tax=Psychrobacillus sp. NPDC058041 TaxID=3346310 RepID=UPI0036DA8393
MKSILLLSAFLISFSLLFIQSDSYSTAEIRSDATIRVVPEGEALIAVNYDEENRKIKLTNNMEKTIEIESMNPASYVELYQASIRPGETIEYGVIGKSEELYGQNISFKVRWSEGSADILTILPMFAEEPLEELPIEAEEGEVDEEELVEVEVEPDETTTPVENEGEEVEEIEKIEEPITTQPDIKK